MKRRGQDARDTRGGMCSIGAGETPATRCGPAGGVLAGRLVAVVLRCCWFVEGILRWGQCSGNSVAVVFVCFAKMLDHLFLQLFGDFLQAACDGLDESLLFVGRH